MSPPYLPLRPCKAPHCPNVVHAGFCDAHQEHRASSASYGHTWRKVRVGYLRSVGWRCQRCGHRPVKGLHVHHIRSLESGGARFDWANLEALCPSCHNKSHPEKGWR